MKLCKEDPPVVNFFKSIEGSSISAFKGLADFLNLQGELEPLDPTENVKQKRFDCPCENAKIIFQTTNSIDDKNLLLGLLPFITWSTS